MPVQDEVPKSRITLTYKTDVDGEPAVVDLPLRLMVLGDFSNGSSKDRQVVIFFRVVSIDSNVMMFFSNRILSLSRSLRKEEISSQYR